MHHYFGPLVDGLKCSAIHRLWIWRYWYRYRKGYTYVAVSLCTHACCDRSCHSSAQNHHRNSAMSVPSVISPAPSTKRRACARWGIRESRVDSNHPMRRCQESISNRLWRCHTAGKACREFYQLDSTPKHRRCPFAALLYMPGWTGGNGPSTVVRYLTFGCPDEVVYLHGKYLKLGNAIVFFWIPLTSWVQPHHDEDDDHDHERRGGLLQLTRTWPSQNKLCDTESTIGEWKHHIFK